MLGLIKTSPMIVEIIISDVFERLLRCHQSQTRTSLYDLQGSTANKPHLSQFYAVQGVEKKRISVWFLVFSVTKHKYYRKFDPVSKSKHIYSRNEGF